MQLGVMLEISTLYIFCFIIGRVGPKTAGGGESEKLTVKFAGQRLEKENNTTFHLVLLMTQGI